MSGILNVDNIYNEAGSTVAYTSYMQRRVVQRTVYSHRVGWWYPDNTYYWVPGAYLDFRPLRSDTRIRVTMSIPAIWYGSAHHISHWIFYKDDIEYGRHSRSGHHTENAFTQQWDVPGWQAGQIARIGYKVRAYASGNHSTHLYFTNYWDGGGASWHLKGQIFAEEYVPIS